MVGISLAHQFWLHSTLIPKLGPLEWVLNTPSARRVRHGSNAEYLDKNFGGIVIVFHRPFGPWVVEDDAIPNRVGLVHNVDMGQSARHRLRPFFDLIRGMIKAPG